ncbi:hypothetical protein GCM10009430_21960 [Aquimarina litoralis]|uniref:Cytochrome C and Quinol oxidase polypeptide I n=2 Tax=Aquimarina litoralis TaxID=584605 RepID=A0ABN1IU00_9FLAO
MGILLIDYDKTVDVNVHDTYYVMQAYVMNLFSTVVFLVIGIVYWSFGKMKIELNPILTKLHTIITIVFVVLLIVIPEISKLFFDGFYYGINAILFVLGLIIIVTQFIFIANILRGIFLKLKNI